MPNHKNYTTHIIKFHIPAFVTFILRRLKNAGHQAFIVGGAIRDACLQSPITDWDVATSATSGEIKKIFRDKRHFLLKHETVTLVNEGRHFEVTTFRGRKDCLEEDLARRDFTINAMAYDLNKNEILDPYEGKADIARKLVRSVGDPGARFHEDPLRLLRAVRFSAELGFRIEKETLRSLISLASLICSVAPERIREELMKVLISQKPSIGFKIMVKTGLLAHFLPELSEGYIEMQNAYIRHAIFKHIMETVDRVEPVPFLRLTALLHDIAKPLVGKKVKGRWQFHRHEEASANLAEEIMCRLRINKEMIHRVKNLIRHHTIGYDSGWSDGKLRRLIRRVGTEDIFSLLIFHRANILAHGLQNKLMLNFLPELEERIKHLSDDSLITNTNDLAIKGNEVMEILRISSGPVVGRILTDLMEKITDHPELNSKEKILGLLEQMKSI